MIDRSKVDAAVAALKAYSTACVEHDEDPTETRLDACALSLRHAWELHESMTPTERPEAARELDADTARMG